MLTLGQKSGMVYGIEPDDNGKILWQMRAGKGGQLGGIEWGSAADEQNIYVPVSDVLRPPAEAGGLHAVRSRDRRAGLARPGAAAEVQGRAGVHGCTVGANQRDPRAPYFPARSMVTCGRTRRRTERSSGTSTPCAVSNGERRQGTGRVDRRGRTGDCRRDGADQFRLRPVAGQAGNVLLAFGVK